MPGSRRSRWPIPGSTVFPVKLVFKKDFPQRKREVAFITVFYAVLSIALSLIWINYTSIAGLSNLGSAGMKEKRAQQLVESLRKTSSGREQSKLGNALAEIGEAAVEPLIPLLKDKEPGIRETAAQALGRIRSPKAVSPLLESITRSGGSNNFSAIWALGELKAGDAVPILITFLKNENAVTRFIAGQALGKIASEEVVDALISGLNDRQWYVRIAFVEALGMIKSKKATAPLIKLLETEQGEYPGKVRRAVVFALMEIGAAEAAEALEKALKDKDWEVRFYAAVGLKKIRLSSGR